MQVRLEVQRAHEAIVKALEYNAKELERETEAYENKIDGMVKQLLLKRTIFGAPRYNEVTARKKAHNHFCSFEIHCRNRMFYRLEEMLLKVENVSGFLVLFEDEEYQRFMNFL